MDYFDIAPHRLAALRQAIRAVGSPSLKQLLIDVFCDQDVRDAVLTSAEGVPPIHHMGRAARLAAQSTMTRHIERPALHCAAMLRIVGEAFAQLDRANLPPDSRLDAREHLRLVLRRPLARLEANDPHQAELVRVASGLGDDELWGANDAARLQTIVTVALARAQATQQSVWQLVEEAKVLRT